MAPGCHVAGGAHLNRACPSKSTGNSFTTGAGPDGRGAHAAISPSGERVFRRVVRRAQGRRGEFVRVHGSPFERPSATLNLKKRGIWRRFLPAIVCSLCKAICKAGMNRNVK